MEQNNNNSPELKLVQKVVSITGTSPFYQLVDEADYAYMVDFELNNDDAVVLPYGYFVSAYCTANSKLHIKFNNWEVTISGRNLKPIYKGIVRQKLKYVRMASADEVDNIGFDSYVSEIKVVHTHENIAAAIYRADSDILLPHTDNADKPEYESETSHDSN